MGGKLWGSKARAGLVNLIQKGGNFGLPHRMVVLSKGYIGIQVLGGKTDCVSQGKSYQELNLFVTLWLLSRA